MPTSSRKPYRVYRQPRRGRGDGMIVWSQDAAGPNRGSGGRHARTALRLLRRGILIVIAAALCWGAVAFLSFRSAVHERNAAVPAKVEAALSPTNGPALSASQVTLLVGADTSAHRRSTDSDPGRADTLVLLRTDVPSRTVSMLSIPRDLYVEVPGYGREKINAAYPNGGLPLAIRTVRSATGIRVNHVMQVDFDGFKEVVDALGGVTINNPTYITSGRREDNLFDGRHWTFRKGEITLNGRNALAYARMRKTVDPKESTDLARAARQQRVIDAIVAKVASVDSVLHPRKVPRAVVQPLLTDVTASEMAAFGFANWWATPGNNLRCRLGGDQDIVGGQDVLIPDEQNRAAVRMFLGRQAPVAPSSPLTAGCVRQAR